MDSEELLEELKEGRDFTMGGSRYILIEFQPGASASHMCRRLRQPKMTGYPPAIANMKRYLIQLGKFTQMNFFSLQENPLHKNIRWCWKMVLDGNVYLLRSDMYHINQRKLDIKKAFSWLSPNCTRSRLYWIVWKIWLISLRKRRMGR
ncbi:CpsB/CapC family capsule biosynthesis tyrosine phosphatase [Clostridium sp. AM29-11AC]|uniref:CpsB/CapC family capsule biosynthesis tyrosine phosphatase n=1 Tax=Clostridium sp. AM29-11AC TaxID=2293028 RepID=UPI0026C1EFB4